MERAFLSSPSARPGPGAGRFPAGATLIVGSEYCQNCLPSADQLARLRRRHRGKISLATSLLTDAGLARLEALLRRAVKGRLISELIANDWGLLPFIRRTPGFSVSAGRLLVEELSRMDPAWARQLCREHRIASAEADNPGLARRIERGLGLKVSYHVPYRFKAVTTFCPFERHFRADCAFTCARGGPGRLWNPHVGQGLYLHEKAYFVKSPPGLPRRGVWRTVRHRLLP